eukprot:15362475-Ditylum_brightwellii.AAC.2
MPPHVCCPNLLDSMSAVGWLYKLSFNPDTQYKHTALARRYAEVGMDHNLVGYSQHICEGVERDYLVGLLSGASTAQAKGVKTSTHKKFNLHRSRWEEFVEKVGLPDPFLEGLGAYPKVRLVCAFMESVRRRDYSQGCTKGIQSATT